MNAKSLMMEVAERAYWGGIAFSDRMRRSNPSRPKPGDFFLKHLSLEEQETLRDLKSKDIENVRVDGVFVLSPCQFELQ